MSDARYFIPDHATLKDVYSKDELRGLLQSGKLSRSDILVDDETGLAHLLGDLLRTPYREPRRESARPPNEAEEEDDKDENETEGETNDDEPAPEQEFRAHTPLPKRGRDSMGEIELELPADEEETSSGEEFVMEEADENDVSGKMPAPNQEELLYHGHPSWLAYPRSILALFAFGAAAWLFHFLHAELAWVVVSGALSILPILFVALDRATTSYFITTRRVEMEFGLLGRSTKEVRIADIRAIDVVQEGYNAVVGIGNVRFDSAAGPESEVEFTHVRRPHWLKQAVRELQG
ncbi:MAG TPA: PH domain-containing protein [Verrucomicrobiaceae bacterium]